MANKKTALHASILLTLILALGQITQAQSVMASTPASIDIFTTTERPIRAIDAFVQQLPDIEVRIHKLDAIKQFEDSLSQGLPADADKAKRRVLQRLQRVSKATRHQLERSAKALAQAARYGVEQYPAVVFDGELVVYGLTDSSVALAHYRHWQQGQVP